ILNSSPMFFIFVGKHLKCLVEQGLSEKLLQQKLFYICYSSFLLLFLYFSVYVGIESNLYINLQTYAIQIQPLENIEKRQASQIQGLKTRFASVSVLAISKVPSNYCKVCCGVLCLFHCA
ncbi:hypothetical protein VIGAN_11179000, partial [Vigna angularis var. angularis]